MRIALAGSRAILLLSDPVEKTGNSATALDGA
jgi:hypothetical protein